MDNRDLGFSKWWDAYMSDDNLLLTQHDLAQRAWMESIVMNTAIEWVDVNVELPGRSRFYNTIYVVKARRLCGKDGKKFTFNRQGLSFFNGFQWDRDVRMWGRELVQEEMGI